LNLNAYFTKIKLPGGENIVFYGQYHVGKYNEVKMSPSSLGGGENKLQQVVSISSTSLKR